GGPLRRVAGGLLCRSRAGGDEEPGEQKHGRRLHAVYNNSIEELHMRIGIAVSLVSFVFLVLAIVKGGIEAQPGNATLTAVPGIKVGHHTLTERPTGCTVILAEAGATTGVDVRGAAPATRETDLLRPGNLVQIAHGIVLSGGSAFGLDSAAGVMRYLEEKKIGFEFGHAYVPIVPAAALFDLQVGDGTVRPTADCGYRAALAASAAPVAEGSVGAGA